MTNKLQYVVYVICDPDTLEVRYVGKTNNIQHRISDHISNARRGKDEHRNRWIRKLLTNNKKPLFEVVHVAENESDILEAEIFLISLLRNVNCNLTNKTPGGDSGKMDLEVIKRRAKNRCRQIMDSNGKIYSSIKEAAQELKVTHTAIHQSLKKNIKCQGLNFSRIKAISKSNYSPEGLINKNKASSKPIIDQYGTTYPSLKAAAETIGCGYKGIWKVLTGRQTSIYGYKFKLLKEFEDADE